KLSISELDTFIEKLKRKKNINDLGIEDMQNLVGYLDIILDEKSNISENGNIYLKIYASGILQNGKIIYAINKFYGRLRFSDIAIVMENADYLTDNGICYRK
ncbi:4518_t:CDS:1, partial [Funneliformis mosseae]